MKTLFLFFGLLLSGLAYSQQVTNLDTAIWKNNYNKCLIEAKEKNLPVLMVFSGSDWCKPCIKLREKILVSPAFSEWAKTHVVCLSLDFPSQKKNALSPEQQKHNDALAEKYNSNGVFPLVMIIDANEKVLGFLNYLDVSPEEYIAELEKLINPSK